MGRSLLVRWHCRASGGGEAGSSNIEYAAAGAVIALITAITTGLLGAGTSERLGDYVEAVQTAGKM